MNVRVLWFAYLRDVTKTPAVEISLNEGATVGDAFREVVRRWPDARIAVQHRAGRLVVGEVSVAIAVACPHRAEAFACCRHVIDRVKEAVPIWKREESPDGARWLEGHDYKP